EGKETVCEFKHLLVAHYGMRQGFQALVENEIALAQKGEPAAITIKLNSLEDERMIKKLYEASNAGVKVNMIVRGICCLIPGLKTMSENIRGISIIDRFLEHDRVYIFNNGGDEKIYLSSADWMKRNLSRRIEVAFPVYDTDLKNMIKHIVNIKLSDNVKARTIDEKQTNTYRKTESNTDHRSQYEIYEYMKSFK
ncbi:MAG TPA: phospholipase D-like domain-containing protein, partial [Ignavibacteria bacterium]|nr:phospholipase D-like domain-containing protein [Ignavibacteria bacterium]